MAKGSGGFSVGKMRDKSIRAENKYRAWAARQPKAKAEVEAIIRSARSIPNAKNRAKYIERQKRAFDRRWIEAYSNR
jgi:hypothetical protein